MLFERIEAREFAELLSMMEDLGRAKTDTVRIQKGFIE